jgi:hypothetical protein
LKYIFQNCYNMNKNYSLIFFVFLIFLAGAFMKPYYDFLILNSLYREWKYQEIIEEYSENFESSFLHNIGNSYYRLYEREENIEYLTASIWAFSGSLQIEDNDDTRFNYDFVRSLLLNREEKEQDKKEQDTDSYQQDQWSEQQLGEQKNWNEQSGGDEQSTDSNTWWTGSVQQDSQNWQENTQWQDSTSSMSAERREEYSLDENDAVWALSDEDKKALERQIEALKQQQIYNQRYFWKQNQQPNFGSIFDNFLWEVERGWEKNW